jgi:acyl dehydratase
VTAKVHDALNVPVRSEPYRVEAAATIAYARAINDDDPAHLRGRVAPPLFAVVPALKTLVRAKRLATEEFTLHGEHDITFQRPIVPGMTLTVEAQLVGVRATPAGTTLIVHGITRAADGTPVNDQYLVNIVQGRHLADDAGIPAPDHRLSSAQREIPPVAQVAYDLDPDQTRRYAEASGDRDPYTFDAEEAKRRGLPGPIVHGLCTMAFVSRAVVATVCGGDSTRLRRLAVRFSNLLMMRPGQSLLTTIWPVGGAGARSWFGCESGDPAGTVVIRHGRAEIDRGEGEAGTWPNR